MSNELKEQILFLRNKKRMTMGSIAKKLNISKDEVNRIARKRNKSNINKEYWRTLDVNYFEKIDSETKAYLLGFLAGDGNVTKSNMIRVRIVKSDEEIINLFKKELNYHKPNKYVKLKNGNDQVHLSFRSEKMCNDLSKYGIVPNKTFTLDLPNIEKKFMHSYLLGLFDADGSIFYSKFLRKGRNKNTEIYRFSITTNTKLCNQISDFLEKELNIKLSISSKKNTKNISIAQISKNKDMVYLSRYLYQNPNMGLLRKKLKFAAAHDFYLYTIQDGCSTTTIVGSQQQMR
jgi:DNA-binding Lrp family transcriptional regulator